MISIQNPQVTIQNAEHKTDTPDRSEIRKAAKDMEAIFINELLKAMRKTTEAASSEEKGMGNETYMSLFDMEVSKMIAERGMGLQDAIVNSLERKPHMSDTKSVSGSDQSTELKKKKQVPIR